MVDSQLKFCMVKKDKKQPLRCHYSFLATLQLICMCFMQKTGLKMVQYQKKEEILKCGENAHFWKILQRPWQGRIVKIGRF